MDEFEWIKQEADKLKSNSPEYEERAFYTSLGNFASELSKRIEQKESELDGRIWNHDRW